MVSTYGKGPNADLRSPGVTLTGVGVDQQRDGMSLLGGAAQAENQRNITNQQLAQQERAGKVQLGATLGTTAGMMYGMKAGSVGGPWGAAIGAAVGAIAGSLF